MTVIVVRRDDSFSQQLRDADLDVINLELVDTEIFENLDAFDKIIGRLDEYDGIFFTSPVAAKVFVDKVKPSLNPKLYALGRRAMEVLIEGGFAVKSIPAANTAEEMLRAFGEDEFRDKKLVFVRGEQSIRTIPKMLADIADIDEVAVYRAIELEPTDGLADIIRERLTSGEVEWICLFSPSAAKAFEKQFGTVGVNVAAIGETTAAKVRELGFNCELVALRATNEVFASELIKRVNSKRV